MKDWMYRFSAVILAFTSLLASTKENILNTCLWSYCSHGNPSRQIIEIYERVADWYYVRVDPDYFLTG